MEAMEISRSGMDVEWRRLQVIAQNLANASTTRTADGGSYRPLRLLSGPVENFQRRLEDARTQAPNNSAPLHPLGVRIYGIEPANGGLRQVHEPSHPHADPDGFVNYPNVSQAEEMTLMIKATRAYEANLVAMAAARQIYSSALQIGRQS